MSKATTILARFLIAALCVLIWIIILRSCYRAPGAAAAPGNSQIGKSESQTPGVDFFEFQKFKHICFFPEWDSSKVIFSLNNRVYNQNKLVNLHAKLNWGNMIYGYARVSREDQELQRQITALQAAGCEEIFSDKMSGAKNNRPEYTKLLSVIQPGDMVIVVKLDRFGRSAIHLLDTLEDFRRRNISFKSLNDSFDINTANGRMLLGVLAVVAEFERELIRERTIDGLRQARLNGKILGRPFKDQSSQQAIFDQYLADGKTIEEIKELMNIKTWKAYQLRTNSQIGNIEMKVV